MEPVCGWVAGSSLPQSIDCMAPGSFAWWVNGTLLSQGALSLIFTGVIGIIVAGLLATREGSMDRRTISAALRRYLVRPAIAAVLLLVGLFAVLAWTSILWPLIDRLTS